MKGVTIRVLAVDEFQAVFQSTLPMKGVTGMAYMIYNWILVSIHTPNEGSDPVHPRDAGVDGVFQSTLPMKGVTIIV